MQTSHHRSKRSERHTLIVIGICAVLAGTITAFIVHFTADSPKKASKTSAVSALNNLPFTKGIQQFFHTFTASLQRKRTTAAIPTPTPQPPVKGLLVVKPHETYTEQDFQFIKDETIRKQ